MPAICCGARTMHYAFVSDSGSGRTKFGSEGIGTTGGLDWRDSWGCDRLLESCHVLEGHAIFQ
jgi:hypothetical protein